jgi:hypothetical protein
MDSGRYFSEVGLAWCLNRILDEGVISVNAASSLLEISRCGKEDRKVGQASARDRKDLRLIFKEAETHVSYESECIPRKGCDKKHIPAKSAKQIWHDKRSLWQFYLSGPELSSF